MTDREHADAAVAALRKTTVTYERWAKNVAAGKYPALGPPSQFGIAFQHLAAIDNTTVAAPAAPGSTGIPVTSLPYSDSVVLNIQQSGTTYSDIAIDSGSGDSAILIGSGGNFKSGVTMRRIRIRQAAVGNKVAWGKHGVYMDCHTSTFEDFDIYGSPWCSNGFSVRMGGTVIRRATITDCYLPIGVFDSDTGQSNGTVVLEDVDGTFSHDTAVWCDAQDDFKTTFDLKVTFRRCSMTGPGVFLKADRVRNGRFTFQDCTLNGQPLSAKDVPAGSTISQTGGTVTDQDYAAQADKAFRATTISYPKWLQNVNAGKYPSLGPPSQWGIGFQALKNIGTTSPPPPPPSGTPTLAHPYAADSVWNTPITNPTVSPDTAAQISKAAQNAGEFGPTVNSVPSIYTADATTPRVTVDVNYPNCRDHTNTVPIDPRWKPGNGGEYGGDAEPTMVVRDTVSGDEWGMFGVSLPGAPAYNGCTGTTHWGTGRTEKDSWWGSGTGNSCRGSGTLQGTGAITPEQTHFPAGSDWGHAVAMAYSYTRNTHVWPAQYSDGTHTDAASIPMGARFWLPPGYDIEASGLREWQKQLLRTTRKYGIVIVDTGAALLNEGLASVRFRGLRFAWEDDGGWIPLPSTVVAKFQVIY